MIQAKTIVRIVALLLAVLVIGPRSYAAERSPGSAAPDRTVLPIQAPKQPVYKELDVRNVKMPPNFEVKAPAGAPNVVIVLIDDLGFGAPETFGGPIPTPTLERLAQEGLRYNTSIPRHCARPRARRSSPDATTTP